MDQITIFFRRSVLFFQSLIKLVKGSFAKYRTALFMLFIGALVGIFVGGYISSSSRVVYADSGQKSVTSSNELKASEIIPLETEPIVVTPKQRCLEISGAVKSPGVYCRDESSYLTAYIDLAGGFEIAKYAKDYVGQRINLASKPDEGSKVYIPYSGEVVCKLALPDTVQQPNYPGGSVNDGDDYTVSDEEIAGEVGDEDNADATEDPVDNIDDTSDEESSCSGLISLNKAPIEDLMTLPGIGESTAKKIIAARPFTATEELLDVSGIGESKYSSIKDLVCID